MCAFDWNLPVPVAKSAQSISLTTLVVLVAASVGVRPRVKLHTTATRNGKENHPGIDFGHIAAFNLNKQ